MTEAEPNYEKLLFKQIRKGGSSQVNFSSKIKIFVFMLTKDTVEWDS